MAELTQQVSLTTPLMAWLTLRLVFVFPPRAINKRGPMIWNVNLLAFAGVGSSKFDGDIQ